MKLSFNLKKQEANFEADVEGLVEKSIENNQKKPPKKSRYQIKQEEMRKNEELKHEQEMEKKRMKTKVWFIVVIFFVLLSFLYKLLGWA